MILERPLLAAKATDEDLKRLPYPMLMSPKIDGVRALVGMGHVLSRSMKLIPNPYVQAEFARPEFDGLDGELVVGSPTDKNCMQNSMAVTRKSGRVAATYYVFDKWNEPGHFRDRLAKAGQIVSMYSQVMAITWLPHEIVRDYEHLLEIEKSYLAAGYEGGMLRLPNGRYKQNRSTLREAILVKVKRFVDSEAQVLDYEPLYRNENDQQRDERGYAKRSTSQDGLVADDLLGALWVQDIHSGVIFSIGSGLTLSQRQQLWADKDNLKGRIIKYKSFPVGVKDKPRIPIFLGFRSRIDI